MIVYDEPGEVPADFGPSSVTIGKFDGVHAGHRAIISELVAEASRDGVASVAVTFDRNPKAIVDPENCPKDIVGVARKLELLKQLGLNATLLLRFDHELSSWSPEEFVERVLVRSLGARSVLVGDDFRYGARGAGDVALLRTLGERWGFAVHTVEDVTAPGLGRVSSTQIRELIESGEVGAATRLLSDFPTVSGTVVHGAKRGRELGFPTANLAADSEGLVPADGVYAGWLDVDGVRHPAAISVGTNPTFTGVTRRQVEAHVIDHDWIDLYGRTASVQFVERIRGMVAYEGVQPLIAQMHDDTARAREILGLRDRGSGVTA